jgi:transposase
VGEKRTLKTLLTFFHWLGSERSGALRFICSDVWKPYLKVIAKKAGQAIHVLDRFHIMGHFGKAIDEVRGLADLLRYNLRSVRSYLLKEKGVGLTLTNKSRG